MSTPDQRPTPSLDVVSEGAERARQLLHDGGAPIVVLGPPGFGKTRALSHLETWCSDAGLVARRHPVPADPTPPDVVLVDDVHRLAPGELEAMADRYAGSARLVVTARPAGFGQPTCSQVDRLMARGHTVLLEPWSADEISAAIEQLDRPSGSSSPDVTAVLELTGGLPWLVVEVLLAGIDPSAPGTRPGHPSRPEREVLRAVARLPGSLSAAVLALSVGYPLDRGPLPAPLRDRTAGDVRGVFDALSDAGLLTIDGRLPPLVRLAVVAHVPRHRIRPYLETVVEDLNDCGVDVAPLAEVLVAAGVRDARLAAAVERCADARLADEPARAAAQYLAALDAGGDLERLAVRRAEALALAGDVEQARSVLSTDSAERSMSAERARVATTLAMLAGQPQQAVTLARWAVKTGSVRPSDDAAATLAYVLFGCGDRALAGDLLRTDPAAAPALSEPRTRTMVDAVQVSLGSDPMAALPSLVQAALSSSSGHRPRLLPDVPAALAALVAINTGDLAMADSVLSRPGAPRSPAALAATPSDGARLAALRGWTDMLAGRYAAAQDELDQLGDRGASARDVPWIWGLRVGLARRQDDIAALARWWVDARGVLMGHPVDLYSLLPLGEIGLAAARMGEPDIAAPTWDQAVALLTSLGRPSLWGPAFHWYGVQAAILTDRPAAMVPHATALVAASSSSPLAAVLSRAGRSWLSVLAREVDPVTVQAAARSLADVGQAWEGARLAGHAAARALDRKDAAVLLECARGLQAPPQSGGAAPGPAQPTPAQAKAGVVHLSAREREVVELVLAGLTYRQIGESLYLSAKTVEHHMARIKRRSGATSRSDLLHRLSISVG